MYDSLQIHLFLSIYFNLRGLIYIIFLLDDVKGSSPDRYS